MTDEQDVVRWIFELMVHHLERTDERERAIHRLEVTDQGLEIVRKKRRPLPRYRAEDRFPPAGKGEREMKAENAYNDVIQITVSDWNALVEACEAALNFLDYDQRKMSELRLQFPDFPWEKRAQMIKRISDQLRAAIEKIEGDVFEEVEED